MSSFRSGPPSPGSRLPVKTGACPAVAELIDYARGQAGPEDAKRIETHLRTAPCAYCHRWLDRAKGLAGPAAVDTAPAAIPVGKWQQAAAFRELEGRLQKVEEDRL